jgi:hypothetical protein
LAGGFIVWNFCTATINDSTVAFIHADRCAPIRVVWFCGWPLQSRPRLHPTSC